MSSAVTDELFSQILDLCTQSEVPHVLIDFGCQLCREHYKKKGHCSGNVDWNLFSLPVSLSSLSFF